jgi:hypothetical protein
LAIRRLSISIASGYKALTLSGARIRLPSTGDFHGLSGRDQW